MHGQKYTMANVQKMVTEDPNMHNLTCKQEKEFIKQLMDHHKLQTSSVQASNVVAAWDAVAVTVCLASIHFSFTHCITSQLLVATVAR